MSKAFMKPRGITIERNCWYNVAKVAKYFDCSEETIRRLIKKNEIKDAIRCGDGSTSYRIWGKAIIDYQEANKVS